MNEASLKYTAYKSLLEGRITQDQYDFITEAGVMSMLGSGVKNLFGALKKGASTVKDTYNQGQFQDVKNAAEVAIKKLVKQLRTVGAKLDKSDEDIAGAIAAVLSGALQEAGIDPKALLAVDRAIPGMTAAGEDEDEGKGGSTEGSVSLTPEKVKEDPSILARVAAAVSGKDADKAAEDAKEKNVNTATMIKITIDAITSATGVDEAKVKKILKVLMTSGLLEIGEIKEALRRMRSTIARRSREPLLERWQQLAGLKIIKEESRFVDGFVKGLKDLIANKKLKDANDLTAHLENEISGLGSEGEEALNDIEKNKDSIVKSLGIGGTIGRKIPAALDDAIEAAKKKVVKPSAAEDDEKPAGGADSAATEADAKTYQNSFKAVREQLKDDKDVTDEDILKVVKKLDLSDVKGASLSVK